MTDFNFTTNGFYYRLLPNNDQAVKVFNEVAEHFEGGDIPLSAWASVKYQIKQAGYTIRKARKIKKLNDDALLAELAA